MLLDHQLLQQSVNPKSVFFELMLPANMKKGNKYTKSVFLKRYDFNKYNHKARGKKKINI